MVREGKRKREKGEKKGEEKRGEKRREEKRRDGKRGERIVETEAFVRTFPTLIGRNSSIDLMSICFQNLNNLLKNQIGLL